MTDMTAEQALPKPKDALAYLINRLVPPTSKDAASNVSRSIESLRQALTAPRVPDGWLVTRESDPSFPQAFASKEKAEQLQRMVTIHPLAEVHPLFLSALLTAAPAPADSELTAPERNSYDKVIADQDAELAKLRARVKVLEDVLHKMIGVPASAGVCEPIEGYVERPHDAVDAMRGMAARLREGGA